VVIQILKEGTIWGNSKVSNVKVETTPDTQ